MKRHDVASTLMRRCINVMCLLSKVHTYVLNDTFLGIQIQAILKQYPPMYLKLINRQRRIHLATRPGHPCPMLTISISIGPENTKTPTTMIIKALKALVDRLSLSVASVVLNGDLRLSFHH